MKDLRDYSLLAHNTFGIDARCSRFLEYETAVEAQQVANILRETSIPYIIIGGGSNLLLTRDFPGIVVHSAVKGWDIAGCRMACGSGETWDDIVAISLQNGLYGAENCHSFLAMWELLLFRTLEPMALRQRTLFVRFMPLR